MVLFLCDFILFLYDIVGVAEIFGGTSNFLSNVRISVISEHYKNNIKNIIKSYKNNIKSYNNHIKSYKNNMALIRALSVSEGLMRLWSETWSNMTPT